MDLAIFIFLLGTNRKWNIKTSKEEDLLTNSFLNYGECADPYSKYVPIARPRVARFTRAIPRSASAASRILHAKIRLSKSHHGPELWASQNIFAGRTTFEFWPNMAIS